jgi:hypothetical protein
VQSYDVSEVSVEFVGCVGRIMSRFGRGGIESIGATVLIVGEYGGWKRGR